MTYLEARLANGFHVSYDGSSIVTVTKDGSTDYANDVREAHFILNKFRATKPGSTWGNDGVGYAVNRDKGIIAVHKSGVGPRSAGATFKAI